MHVNIIYDADVGSSEDRECCDSFRRWSVQPEEGVGLQEIDHRSEDRECCDSSRRWSVQPEDGVGLQEIDHSLGRYVQSV